MTNATLLQKRLASYAAAAGVTLALAPAGAAQVVYQDLDPDLMTDLSTPIEIDVDGDGVVDFEFSVNEGAAADTMGRVVLAGTNNTLNGVAGIDAQFFTNPALGSAFNLDAGAEVEPEADEQIYFEVGLLASVFQNTPYYNFIGEEGFVGFRFVAGTGGTHYGWARLSAGADALSGVLFEYAFESTPDTPIVAGATGVASEPGALADGYLFSEVAPNPIASGRASFELAVGSAEAVSVDVFDSLGRRVQTAFTGALVPGVSQTVDLDTSALPAGVYVVRVSGESFVSTRNVTVVR